MALSCCNPGYCCNSSLNIAPCYGAVGSPQIGNPSQTPGSNPSTTTNPTSTSGTSFLGSLGNIGTTWLSTVAKASVAPGSQVQRAVYGNNAFGSLTTGGGFIIVVLVAAIIAWRAFAK